MASLLADDIPIVDIGDEKYLVERAKRDATAVSILYRRHYSAIDVHIRRRLGDCDEADDLVSEVFLAMVRYLPRYRCRGVPFRAWLYRLATTQISRWTRRKRRMVMTQLTSTHLAVDERSFEGVPAAPSLEAVRLALLTLPKKYQNVILLHYLERMPIGDVAQTLGCPTGTVKSRLARGRDMLRRRLRKKDMQ